jgi:hypothetical protein
MSRDSEDYYRGIEQGKQQTLKDVLKIIDERIKVVKSGRWILTENIREFVIVDLEQLKAQIEKELGEKK